jgi:hypothetical protein
MGVREGEFVSLKSYERDHFQRRKNRFFEDGFLFQKRKKMLKKFSFLDFSELPYLRRNSKEESLIP